ncbi:MAG: N-acetyltransferase [Pseudomonadota bacterium]
MIEILPETPARHADPIEALFNTTFGPGHFAKTAERLREFSTSLPQINRVAIEDGKVIGVCRVWPIRIGETQALFYGPVAVSPSHQGNRLGLTITGEALEAGEKAGWSCALLIGASSYFGDLGFEVAPHGHIQMPGPQDPARVMLRALAGPKDVSGAVKAA